MNGYKTEVNPYEVECIDPELAGQLWRLDDPACPDDWRERLTAHVAHCAGCRLERAVARQVAGGLVNGTLAVPQRTTGETWTRRTILLGAVSLAAGLALVLLSPPAGRRADLTLRGEDGPAIVRPAPDEVVGARRPELRWTPVPEATRYHVVVESVDGTYRWETETDVAHAEVPAGRELPVGERFRVLVTPVPPYLAPAGGLRSSFHTGGPAAWFGHRLVHGSGPGRGLLLLGVAAMVASLTLAGSRRRTA